MAISQIPFDLIAAGAEFGLTPPFLVSDLLAKAGITDGDVSKLAGKSAVISVSKTLLAQTYYNLNLINQTETGEWVNGTIYIFTIPAGCRIRSKVVTSAALTCNPPAGVKVVLNFTGGNVVGAGGQGGTGVTTGAGGNGQDGGVGAVLASGRVFKGSTPDAATNDFTGVIFGGGGGGGAGRGGQQHVFTTTHDFVGGRGGGGASEGAPNGTLDAGGAGAAGQTVTQGAYNATGSAGGKGGNPGQAGEGGSTAQANNTTGPSKSVAWGTPGKGGAAGKAITWLTS